MRARTIGQIATLIAGHLGSTASTASSLIDPPAPIAELAASAVEVDLDALSSEQIDRLLGDRQNPVLEVTSHV
jgi:hypothetical protein